MTSEPRLQRIEERLDKICDAIERIARTEERVHAMMEYANRLDQRLEKLEIDNHAIKSSLALNTKTTKNGEWFVKIVLTAAVTSAVTAFALKVVS